jgi:hypothetical protein
LDKKKRQIIKHPSGNDKDYTIFDALLESLINKEQKESTLRRLLKYITSPWNIVFLSLIFLGLAILTWIGQIIWTDITVYGKILGIILFGSRVGENISLGIDMRLIYYLIIGFMLLLSSLIIRFVKHRHIYYATESSDQKMG